MKDTGQLKYFLGIEVLRSEGGIFISQRKFFLDLLIETDMIDCKPIETPIIHGVQMIKGEKLANGGKYHRLVRKLIYVAHIRPDIAYTVSVVSRFMHQPQAHHMAVVMRILRYLKGTSGRGVFFKKNGHLDLLAYIDAE